MGRALSTGHRITRKEEGTVSYSLAVHRARFAVLTWLKLLKLETRYWIKDPLSVTYIHCVQFHNLTLSFLLTHSHYYWKY